jgi:hypothetical protein
MTDPLKRNANLTRSLISSIRLVGNGLDIAPALLRKVLAEGSWREFVTELGHHVEHERFEEFVTAPPLKGLGADMDVVDKLAALSGDAELAGLLELAGVHRRTVLVHLDDVEGTAEVLCGSLAPARLDRLRQLLAEETDR